MKQTNDTLNFVITHGLPGSGKTTLLNRLCTEIDANGGMSLFVDMDVFHRDGVERALGEAYNIAYYEKRKVNPLWSCINDNTTICLDTLCINELDIVNLIYAVIDRFVECAQIYKYNFIIYDFNENREACIENNKMRALINPKRSAELTIRNAKYGTIDDSSIITRVKERIASSKKYWLSNVDISISIEIKHANVWDRRNATDYENVEADVITAARTVGKVIDDKLYSDDWTTDGKIWGYMGPDYYNDLSPETPNDFEELDRILEVMTPNLSFLQYKKIRKECCYINEFHVSDYYESYSKAQWVCDLKKLAKIIQNYNSK